MERGRAQSVGVASLCPRLGCCSPSGCGVASRCTLHLCSTCIKMHLTSQASLKCGGKRRCGWLRQVNRSPLRTNDLPYFPKYWWTSRTSGRESASGVLDVPGYAIEEGAPECVAAIGESHGDGGVAVRFHGFSHEPEAGLRGSSPALSHVAAWTSCDDVLPGCGS